MMSHYVEDIDEARIQKRIIHKNKAMWLSLIINLI